ncbi:hypothetical protein BvCmsKSP035_02252 [Escherichia coli]|nr:hypothetical protein BvCmsKSP035_02252 [Escherichia coli]
MHSFCELIERSTSFTLYSLEQAETEVIELNRPGNPGD